MNERRRRQDPALAAEAVQVVQTKISELLSQDGTVDAVPVVVRPLSMARETRFGAEADQVDGFDSFFVSVCFHISLDSRPANPGEMLDLRATQANWYRLGMRCVNNLTPHSITGDAKGRMEQDLDLAADDFTGSNPKTRLSLGEVSVEPALAFGTGKNKTPSTGTGLPVPETPVGWLASVPIAIYLPRLTRREAEIGIIDVQINGADERVSVSALDFKDDPEISGD